MLTLRVEPAHREAYVDLATPPVTDTSVPDCDFAVSLA